MLGTHVKTMGGISSVVRNCIEHGTMERLGIKYMATHRDGSKLIKIGFFIMQIPKILLTIPRVDIVHLQTSQGWSFRRLVLFLLVSKILTRKIVLHVHGSSFDKYYRSASSWEQKLIRYGLAVSDIVVALSDQWKAKLEDITPSANVVVIRNAVTIDKYDVHERSMHDPPCVLFLGRLGQRKGVYDILKAIGLLHQEPMNFVLAGDGDVEQVRQHVREHGWEAFVGVPGWVGSDEVVIMLHEADVFILPSYDEGLPMGILEALAAGLPVISTPVGGIPEAVQDGANGFLIEPGDSTMLATRLKTLCSNPQLWKQMSTTARTVAQREFSMQAVEERLSEIYSRLASNKSVG